MHDSVTHARGTLRDFGKRTIQYPHSVKGVNPKEDGEGVRPPHIHLLDWGTNNYLSRTHTHTHAHFKKGKKFGHFELKILVILLIELCIFLMLILFRRAHTISPN